MLLSRCQPVLSAGRCIPRGRGDTALQKRRQRGSRDSNRREQRFWSHLNLNSWTERRGGGKVQNILYLSQVSGLLGGHGPWFSLLDYHPPYSTHNIEVSPQAVCHGKLTFPVIDCLISNILRSHMPQLVL